MIQTIIDSNIKAARANIANVRYKRQLAQQQHEAAVREKHKAIIKAQRKLARQGIFSGLYRYVNYLRDDNSNSKSPYLIQKQAMLIMVLHNGDVMNHQQALVEKHHRETLEDMYSVEDGIENEQLRVQWDASEHLHALRSEKVSLQEMQNREIAKQEMVIKKLRNLLNPADHLEESLDESRPEANKPFMKDFFERVQKKNEEFKSRRQLMPHLSLLRNNNLSRKTVVPKIA